jgi:hypothetical protein
MAEGISPIEPGDREKFLSREGQKKKVILPNCGYEPRNFILDGIV